LDNATSVRKRAILLHLLGVEGNRIFNMLDGTLDTYDAVITALTGYFGLIVVDPPVMPQGLRTALLGAKHADAVRCCEVTEHPLSAAGVKTKMSVLG